MSTLHTPNYDPGESGWAIQGDGNAEATGGPADVCPDHDWRIDPYLILPTSPPRRKLVCARCGALASQPLVSGRPPSDDPREWPRA